jgi:hypothetical protein
MTKFAALITRCMAATGYDYDLNDAIWEALDPEWHRGGHMRSFRGGASECPDYTGSLDVALRTIPTGYRPMIDMTLNRPEVKLWPWNDEGMTLGQWVGKAATPALAVLTAAFKAHDAIERRKEIAT